MDYRKLREIVVMNHASRTTAIKVYEASVRHSLEVGDSAEFVAATTRLVNDYYEDKGQDWAYCALLLFYGSEPDGGEDLKTFFYTTLPKKFLTLPWVKTAVELIIAIDGGNVPRFDLVVERDDLPDLPPAFIVRIRKVCLARARQTLTKAYGSNIPMALLNSFSPGENK